jgi:replicative DNA helicase
LTSTRPFPASVEFERALLGGLILNPAMLRLVVEIVKPEDFYRPDHEHLFRLLLHMEAQGEPIEPVTVPERISREGRADRYGGVPYVVELVDHVPATANLSHYANEIRAKSVLRRFISGTQELIEKAFSQSEDVGRLLESAAQQVITLGNDQGRRAWQRISLAIDDELLRIEKLAEKKDGVTGITTGFTDLDRILFGLHPGDLVVLAARPSMGKTALGLNIAQNAAIIAGVGVGVFSLEMGREQLTSRMLCTQGMVDAARLRTGRLDPEDWERLLEASEFLRKAPIYIDDTPALTLSELRLRPPRTRPPREPSR